VKKILTLTCIALMATSALATGTTTPPPTTTPPTTVEDKTTMTSTTSSAATAAAQAAAAAGAVSGSNSGSSADNSGGNSKTRVDASDHSRYSSRAILVPSTPSLPIVVQPSATVTQVTMPCGPRVHKIARPITGTFVGFFGNSKIDQGLNEDVEDDANPFIMQALGGGREGYRLLGHSVTFTTSVINLGGARQFSLGGGGGSGWGNGGIGSSSQTQTTQTTVRIAPCVFETYAEPDEPVVTEGDDWPAKGDGERG
jgi:hypothetical protein